MKRARSPLLSLAGIILLGTVLLWAGTRGTQYSWGTNSLLGEHRLEVYVGGGQIAFDFVDSKRYQWFAFQEGFKSYPVNESDREFVDALPDFHLDTSAPGRVDAWCPTWFPGALVGGLLLGWGLLCRRDGERISEPKEPR